MTKSLAIFVYIVTRLMALVFASLPKATSHPYLFLLLPITNQSPSPIHSLPYTSLTSVPFCPYCFMPGFHHFFPATASRPHHPHSVSSAFKAFSDFSSHSGRSPNFSRWPEGPCPRLHLISHSSSHSEVHLEKPRALSPSPPLLEKG